MTTVDANNYHDMLNNYLDAYLSDEHILVSLGRDSHMHNWRDSDGNPGGTNGVPYSTYQNKDLASFDLPNCFQFKTLLDKLVLKSEYHGRGKIDVLKSLTEAAKIVRKESFRVPSDFIDAVLVNFINWVGLKCCVDYALYAYDLRK